jgi:hypothetical protein
MTILGSGPDVPGPPPANKELGTGAAPGALASPPQCYPQGSLLELL